MEMPLTEEALRELESKGFKVVKIAPMNPEMNPNPLSPVSLKLSKNTKGYNWDIRIDSLDTTKLKEVNDIMIVLFGSPRSEPGAE